MKSSYYTTFYFLLLISLGYVATDLYLPSLPALSLYFQANDYEAKMTLFSYLLSFSISPLIFGPLSDHIGRKKILIGGVLSAIIVTFCCLFASTIEWMILFRFFQGIGTGAVLISSRASVSDLFTGKSLAKQMSLMTMLMPLILALAPTVGGFLQEALGWKAVFLFLLLYMILIFICIVFYPETLKQSSHEKISDVFSSYRSIFKNRLFLLFGINFILPSLGFFAYLTISPFLFQEILHLSPAEYGILSIYVGATILITGYINLKLLHYFSVTQLLSLGAFMMLIAGCSLLLLYTLNIFNTWSLLIPCLLFFTSLPLCVSNAASKTMSLIKTHFGAASALLTACQFLTGALGSFIFSILSNPSPVSLAICFIAVGLISLINLQYSYRLDA